MRSAMFRPRAGDRLLQSDRFRNDRQSPSAPPLGDVLSVGGAQASVRLRMTGSAAEAAVPRATVATFLGIRTPKSLLIGVITQIGAPGSRAGAETTDLAIGQLDFLGEIKDNETGSPRFQRGVTDYPVIGDPVCLITHDELRLIYDLAGPATIEIGYLQQDASISAYVNIDDLLRKHFAVFGTPVSANRAESRCSCDRCWKR